MQRNSRGTDTVSSAGLIVLLSLGLFIFLDFALVIGHWSRAECSRWLKVWILGKYFFPALSYLSFLFWMPCLMEQTLEAASNIPYTDYESRQRRVERLMHVVGSTAAHSVSSSKGPSPTSHNTVSEQQSFLSVADTDESEAIYEDISSPAGLRAHQRDRSKDVRREDMVHSVDGRRTDASSHRGIGISSSSSVQRGCIVLPSRIADKLPYPLDVFVSEWIVSPTETTHLIALYMAENEGTHESSIISQQNRSRDPSSSSSINNGNDLELNREDFDTNTHTNNSNNVSVTATWVSLVGFICDRAVLLVIWILIGAAVVNNETQKCRQKVSLLYYYAVMEVTIGMTALSLLALWVIGCMFAPMTMSRILVFFDELNCDLISLLPFDCWRDLVSMALTFDIKGDHNTPLKSFTNRGSSHSNGLVSSSISNSVSSSVPSATTMSSSIRTRAEVLREIDASIPESTEETRGLLSGEIGSVNSTVSHDSDPSSITHTLMSGARRLSDAVTGRSGYSTVTDTHGSNHPHPLYVSEDLYRTTQTDSSTIGGDIHPSSSPASSSSSSSSSSGVPVVMVPSSLDGGFSSPMKKKNSYSPQSQSKDESSAPKFCVADSDDSDMDSSHDGITSKMEQLVFGGSGERDGDDDQDHSDELVTQFSDAILVNDEPIDPISSVLAGSGGGSGMSSKMTSLGSSSNHTASTTSTGMSSYDIVNSPQDSEEI